MKKKTTAILLALMILAGCEAAPAAAPAAIPESTPEVSTLAIEEPTPPEESAPEEEPAPSEEPHLEQEVLPDPEETPAPEEEEPPALVSSQPESQPEPEVSTPAQTASAVPTNSYDGFDLKNLYPAFIWENFQPIEEDSSPDDTQEWAYEYETEWEDEYEEPALGTLLEDDALEVIRLTNQERENHGLEPLEIDYDLMALAEIRAEEASTKYSHERPDGTRVSQMGYYGENLGAKASAEKQVASWMNSDGHRANILREGYHRIGVGCYLAENGKHYWIQVFSK